MTVTCSDGSRVEVPASMAGLIARLLLVGFSLPEESFHKLAMLTMRSADKSTTVNLLYTQHTVDVLHYFAYPRSIAPDSAGSFTDFDLAWEHICRWM